MLKLLLKKKKIPVKYWMKISHNIIKIYIYSYIKIWAHKKKKKNNKPVLHLCSIYS